MNPIEGALAVRFLYLLTMLDVVIRDGWVIRSISVFPEGPCVMLEKQWVDKQHVVTLSIRWTPSQYVPISPDSPEWRLNGGWKTVPGRFSASPETCSLGPETTALFKRFDALMVHVFDEVNA